MIFALTACFVECVSINPPSAVIAMLMSNSARESSSQHRSSGAMPSAR